MRATRPRRSTSSRSCSTSTRPPRRSPPCSGATRRSASRPGLRVPGGEGYEIAVRAVLTQQISVKAGAHARGPAGRGGGGAAGAAARVDHASVPDGRGDRGRARQRLRDARAPPRDAALARGRAAARPHRAARDRAVDAGVRVDARAARPRRLARHRPRRAPGARARSDRSTRRRGARSAPTPSSTSGTSRWARACGDAQPRRIGHAADDAGDVRGDRDAREHQRPAQRRGRAERVDAASPRSA